MKVLLFGATGMVGLGVLRECLRDPDVTLVVTIGRSRTGLLDAKLREIVHANLFDYTAIENDLTGFDACFFCLGVSSAGMTEDAYRRITFDLTLAAARTLVRLNPAMTFVFVSGASTDSSERGRSMWARVKGSTENALLALPFKHAYMFRPAVIQPLHGIRSKTGWYNALYVVMRPLLPVLRAVAPRYVTTTELVGKAMLVVAKRGAPAPILENDEINRLGKSAG